MKPPTNQVHRAGAAWEEWPEEDIDRVIQMAWEDRTPFEAIEWQFGLKENDVRALMRRLDAAGYLAVCYDYRGVGASAPLTSERPFSADAWRDFDDVLEHVIAEVGSGCRLFLVGQSLGGSILTKYLTTTRLNRFIPAAVTVSAPRAFVLAAKTLQDGALNKVQNFCMTLPLKLAYLVNGRGPVPFDRKVVLATSLQELDVHATSCSARCGASTESEESVDEA